MEYKTFEDRRLNISDLSHQHLSNIYWFKLIFGGENILESPKSGMTRKVQEKFKEFNNKILDYQPHPKFVSEIRQLDSMGLLKWNDEKTIADIIFRGKKVGEASYLEGFRDKLISEILK